MADKNFKMLEYVLQCSVLAENPLFFNFADEQDNINQFVVTRDDVRVNKPFIDGSVLKQYTADILLYKSVAPNPIVLDYSSGDAKPSETYIDENMVDMRDGQVLIDWILEQEELCNYPDFGETCIVESVAPTTNKPTLNGINGDVKPPLAQFSVGITVQYLDVSKQVWS